MTELTSETSCCSSSTDRHMAPRQAAATVRVESSELEMCCLMSWSMSWSRRSDGRMELLSRHCLSAWMLVSLDTWYIRQYPCSAGGGGGAHLTKPGWSIPHTHSNSTNLALFRHKLTLYRFSQGSSFYCRGAQMGPGGLTPPPHFDHWTKTETWTK